MIRLIALCLLIVSATAADFGYKFSFSDIPKDKAQVRIDIEQIFTLLDVQVKSITIRQISGKGEEVNYVVVAIKEVDIKKLENTYKDKHDLKTVVTAIVVTK